jgi:hypothetical protein
MNIFKKRPWGLWPRISEHSDLFQIALVLFLLFTEAQPRFTAQIAHHERRRPVLDANSELILVD